MLCQGQSRVDGNSREGKGTKPKAEPGKESVKRSLRIGQASSG